MSHTTPINLHIFLNIIRRTVFDKGKKETLQST